MELLDTTASVETPERVGLQHRLAGPGPRGVAWFIDFVLRMVLTVLLALPLLALEVVPQLSGVGTGLLLVMLFLSEWFLGALMEGLTSGRTPGKLLLGLRVVRRDGSPLQPGDALLRNLLRAVDLLPGFYALGVVCSAIDPELRRVGDLVAGTLVVVEERTGVLDPVRLQPPLREEEHRAVPNTLRLTAEETTLVEQLLRRRPQLSQERMEELAALLALPLRQGRDLGDLSHARLLAVLWARSVGRDREGAA